MLSYTIYYKSITFLKTSSCIYSRWPNLPITDLFLLVIIILILGSILSNLKLSLPDNSKYIHSFSTSRATKIESHYQRFYMDQGVPFYLVEGIWETLVDVLFTNDTTLLTRNLTEGSFLSPNFSWDFGINSQSGLAVLEALEARFNIQITGEEATKLHTFKDIVDCIRPKLKPPCTVLVACPGEPDRSVMAGMLINYLGKDRFRAFYLNLQPTLVNPNVLKTLENNGLTNVVQQCQAWEKSTNTPIDIAITLLEKNSEEFSFELPKCTARMYWNIPDPTRFISSEMKNNTAFQHTYDVLIERIELLLAMPVEFMQPNELERTVSRFDI